MSLTRQELDNKLQALPRVIEKSVTDALTPVLSPIAALLHQEDYTEEGTTLDSLPGLISQAIATSVSDLFATTDPAPPATTPAATPEAPTTAANAPIDEGMPPAAVMAEGANVSEGATTTSGVS